MPDAQPSEPPTHGRTRTARIGVFDSGVGGLSVLRSLHQALPGHAMHYLADSAYAPYGERDEGQLVGRSTRITRHLIEHGANIIVVACNTATAAAVQHLRAAWPTLPIVGVEPGIKPALALSINGRIGVMATAATLASAKFRQLVATHRADQQIHLQACTGLAAAIERGELASPEIKALIEQHCQPLRDAGVDTVVLGCTHYPFVEEGIARAMGPQVRIVDTAQAIARRVVQIVAEQFGTDGEPANVKVLVETTGDVAMFDRFARRWLPFEVEPAATPLNARLATGARDGA